MQPAPALSVACRDGGVWRVLTAALHALAAAGLAAWGLAWAEAGATIAWGLAFAAGASAGALAWWRPARDADVLAWDGRVWRVDDAAVRPERMTVVVDVGTWLLLRLQPDDGAARWCALSEAGVGPSWRTLRQALFAGATGPRRLDA